MLSQTLSDDERAVLEVLEKFGEARLYELSSRARLAPSVTLSVVDDLSARNLLKRKNNELIVLTDEGLSTLREIQQSPPTSNTSYGISPSGESVPHGLSSDELGASIDAELEKLK
jgi:DNA-binding MarR family transcriptional regulator